MRFGICTGPEHFAAALAAGYDYVEPAIPLLVPEQDEAAFAPVKAMLLAAPIKAEAFNCFLPGTLKVTGLSVDWAAVARYMDVALRRAAEVGAGVVVFGSGAARRAPEGYPLEQAREQFDAAALLAAKTAARYGLTIALEPLDVKQSNFLNWVQEGSAIVDRVNHPNLRVLADLFHVHVNGEPFANVAAAGARLAHVHLATPSIPETGDGVAYDFPAFFHALADAGYDGRVSVEDNPGLLYTGKLPDLTATFRAVREYVASCVVARA